MFSFSTPLKATLHGLCDAAAATRAEGSSSSYIIDNV